MVTSDDWEVRQARGIVPGVPSQLPPLLLLQEKIEWEAREDLLGVKQELQRNDQQKQCNAKSQLIKCDFMTGLGSGNLAMRKVVD